MPPHDVFSSTRNCLSCGGGRFVDRGIKSEFENDDVSTGNLTDFNTHCTWSDSRVRISMPRQSLFISHLTPSHKLRILQNQAFDKIYDKNSTYSDYRIVIPQPIKKVLDPYFSSDCKATNIELKLINGNTEIKRMGFCKEGFQVPISHIKSLSEKSFSCDFSGCGKLFARNEELTRHKRIHSGERPYKCEMCEKAFGRKDHLTKHRKTHLKASERRIYTCPFPNCERSYTRSDALTRHQWSVHNIKCRQGHRSS